MNIKSWWDNQSERDRRIAFVGGIVIVILVVYVVLWNPISTAASSNKKAVRVQQSLLQYLHTTGKHIRQLRAEGMIVASATPVNLLTLIEQTLAAQKLSIYLKQVQQLKPTQIALTFEKVPFDQLMQWLQALSIAKNVSVTQFSATRAAVGIANVTMTIEKV